MTFAQAWNYIGAIEAMTLGPESKGGGAILTKEFEAFWQNQENLKSVCFLQTWSCNLFKIVQSVYS